MRKALTLALLLSAATARADMILRTARGDAVAVGKQLIAAIGGADAWQRARYFRFDSIVEREGMAPLVRSYDWDCRSGRARVDGIADEGPYRVYFDVATKSGEAWLGGKRVTAAAELKKRIDSGYEAFIRDSIWLLAPFKIFDPGVTLTYSDLARGPADETCDVILVDLGAGHRYSLYVDRKSHLVVEWEYATESRWSWSDWQKRGPIMLASTRKSLKNGTVIRFDKLTVSETPDDASLTPPK